MENRDVPINDSVQPAQFAALQEWGKPVGERCAYLQQNLPNAQLIIYPDAAHGSLFQYPELFVEHTSIFLRA